MNKVKLCLRNAKIPSQNSILEAGIAIDQGKIVSISKNSLLPEADKTIDLEGKLLLPGIVDTHVHFRDPGLTQKENFSTGSKAAAAGGVTTICDMPNNSPYTNTLKNFKEKKKIAKKKTHTDFGLHAMLSDSREEGKKLLEAGATSLKLYPEIQNDSSITNFQNKETIITVHPEDPELLEDLENGDDIEALIQSRPRKAETSEIIKLLSFVSSPYLHFCHISTKESVEIIARKRGNNNISCEVTPHHLLLDKSHLRELGSTSKTYPLLRTEQDRRALLQALERGVIDIVATDHAPHTMEEKEQGLIEAPPGMVGVETSLPLLFTQVRKGKLSLSRLVESMCSHPARIFGLQNENGISKGTLQPGADADLVALDQNKEWEIKGEDLHGKTRFTPFEGREVIGKPFLTLVRGEIMFKEGEIIGKEGHGKFIPRKT